MNASTSAWSALLDIIVEPSKAFRGIEKNTKWLWIPLLLLLLGTMALFAYYYSVVDFDWYKAQTLAAMPADQADQAEQFIKRGTVMTSVLVGTAVVTLVVYLIYSIYLLLVHKLSGDQEHGFGHWFSLSVWSGWPGILSVIAMFGYLLFTGNNQINESQLNFLSLNSLVTQYPNDHALAGVMNGITPFLFWTIGLAALGLKLWTNRSFGKSLLIAAAPYVVLYGIWFAIAAA